MVSVLCVSSTSPVLLCALKLVLLELMLVRKTQSFGLCFVEVTNEAPGLKRSELSKCADRNTPEILMLIRLRHVQTLQYREVKLSI